ncbi:hypothetical protein D1F64_05745 [Breoghania sp. L-A4]|nr:hypothetical protein D1F64_05745 [Breoghania sp. L-A4]
MLGNLSTLTRRFWERTGLDVEAFMIERDQFYGAAVINDDAAMAVSLIEEETKWPLSLKK